MKTRLIIIGAIASLMLGIVITMLIFETIVSEPPENLPHDMTPITTEVGKTSTPVGPYLTYVGILVLLGVGIYSLACFLKMKLDHEPC